MRHPVLSAAICALGLAFGAGQAMAASCHPEKVTLIGEFGEAAFRVAVADDASERAQGLMFVESMPLMEGMLFIYERPQTASFWMKNTLIPLDMIFVDAQGRIISIHENAVPHDETAIFGGDGVQYVLEINGGLAGRLGVEAGDALQYPTIIEGAAAPCIRSEGV